MKKIPSSDRADFALSEKPCERDVAQLLLHGSCIMVWDAEQAFSASTTTEQERS